MDDKGLALLRKPFPASQISKLPKPTKAQTDAVKANYQAGIRCELCGTWHHPKVVHLDYVGHAALTNRLLDCDPTWNWEPLSYDDNGQPLFDKLGGLWIKLTVCGVTRLGYGHADGKTGGDAIKEIIGDAQRNAAMRFGAALDLWSKADLHADQDNEVSTENAGNEIEIYREKFKTVKTLTECAAIWQTIPKKIQPELAADKEAAKTRLTKGKQ